MQKQLLNITNLSVYKNSIHILKNCNLSILPGTNNVLMGPNGAGKSSLAYAILGHQIYLVKGKILFDGKDITKIKMHKRARQGLFLAIQNPPTLEGVSVFSLLKESYRAVYGADLSIYDLHDKLLNYCSILKVDTAFLQRHVNDDFSGGEKKKFELLRLLFLKPKLAILDEIDSGLDVDSLDMVRIVLALLKKETKDFSSLIITHSTSLVKKIAIKDVHIIKSGQIVASGNKCLACAVEVNGYEVF